MASKALACSRCQEETASDGSCENCGLDTDGEPLVQHLTGDFGKSTKADFSNWSCEQCTYINNATIGRCEMCYCPRNGDSWTKDDRSTNLADETRIILVGRTGSGKSATANNILNKDEFKSDASCSSVTSQCHQAQGQRFNRPLQIVDTPGMFDTARDNDSVTREILRCVGLAAPGPHAILLVVGICRFTEEEKQTIRLLQKAFGEDMMKYLIIVFTRKDDLERSGKNLSDLLHDSPPALRSVLAECKQRCIAFNNNGDEAEREQEVLELFEMIDNLVEENRGDYYTSPIFENAEEVMQEREDEIRQENESEWKRKLRTVRRQMSDDYHDHIDRTIQQEHRYNDELRILRSQRRALNDEHDWPDDGATSSRNMGHSDDMVSRKISELETKISAVQRQQRVIKESTEFTLKQRERELRDRLQDNNNQTRNKARSDLENGEAGLLRGIWIKISEAGHNLIDKFRSIFETLKNKFSR